MRPILALLQEPALDAISLQRVTFRFLWLPPFQSQRTICVRVQDTTGGPELEAKALTSDGKSDVHVKRKLTNQESGDSRLGARRTDSGSTSQRTSRSRCSTEATGSSKARPVASGSGSFSMCRRWARSAAWPDFEMFRALGHQATRRPRHPSGSDEAVEQGNAAEACPDRSLAADLRCSADFRTSVTVATSRPSSCDRHRRSDGLARLHGEHSNPWGRCREWRIVQGGRYFLGEHGRYVEIDPHTYQLSHTLYQVGLVGLLVGAAWLRCPSHHGRRGFLLLGHDTFAATAIPPVVLLWLLPKDAAQSTGAMSVALALWIGLIAARVSARKRPQKARLCLWPLHRPKEPTMIEERWRVRNDERLLLG